VTEWVKTSSLPPDELKRIAPAERFDGRACRPRSWRGSDRLAPVREVAQIGAALGRQFSHELIGAVASMPQPQLDDALAQLVGAELIYRRGTPPDAEYTFKHALVQDAAYGTLLRSRRQQLHAHIAATLEDGFPEIVAAQPALLAQHCEEATLSEKAVAYWLAAGRQAWGRSMITEAVTVVRRGLALVPELPDSDWRREREFDLQIALAQALTASGGWGARETSGAYARARQLAVTLNRPRALARGGVRLPRAALILWLVLRDKRMEQQPLLLDRSPCLPVRDLQDESDWTSKIRLIGIAVAGYDAELR
jgi:hypothetical protein